LFGRASLWSRAHILNRFNLNNNSLWSVTMSLMMRTLRGSFEVVGKPWFAIGEALEKLAVTMDPNVHVPAPARHYPVEAQLDDDGYEFDTYPSLPKEPKEPREFFQAPSSKIEGAVLAYPRSSIWYHATVTTGPASQPLVLPTESSLQDWSVFSSKATLGEQVVVGPHSKVADGVKIANRVVIGARVIVGKNAVIEEEVIVGDGSVVKDGQRLEKGKLYAGAGEAGVEAVRDLDADEIAEIVSHAKAIADFSHTHEVEWSKCPLQRDLDREAFKMRFYYAETLAAEMDDDPDQYIHHEHRPDDTPHYRGALYDK
jgi:carbonic anhydrase/acetyltransferase-like protein (isoleucine patch superfamily)